MSNPPVSQNGLPHDEGDESASDASSNESITPEEIGTFFKTAHGRGFHTFPAPYFLPGDEVEFNRLDTQHDLLRQLLADNNVFGPVNDLLTAPTGRTKRVLDLGCGSGTWIEQMTTVYPHVHFVGIDLVPVQRHFHNTRFECWELLALGRRGIRLPSNRFTIIHARNISFGLRSYELLAQESFRVLQPGGLFLSGELDLRPEAQQGLNRNSMPATYSLLTRAMACAVARGTAAGCNPTVVPQLLTRAGFTNVIEATEEVPIGPWRGNDGLNMVGSLAEEVMIQFARAMRPELLDQPGETETTVDYLLQAVEAEIREGGAHWSMAYRMVHGTRP